MTNKVKEKIIRKSAGCFPTYEEYSEHVDKCEKQFGKVKVKEIVGVDKKGRPIENDEVIEFDEQVARAEFEAEYDEPYDDPMDEQHEKKERWDR